MLKIAFDVGGVLSKYPQIFGPLVQILEAGGATVFVVSDMHPAEKILDMLGRNGISVPPERVISADYESYQELCKTKVCESLGIDILVDDFIGYVAAGKHIRLLVMPNPEEPYYYDDWRTDGSEGDFGRRRKVADRPDAGSAGVDSQAHDSAP